MDFITGFPMGRSLESDAAALSRILHTTIVTR